MATVREHFDTTAKALNAQTGWHVQSKDDANPILILGKVSYCTEENARYWSFFIPEAAANIGCLEYLLRMPDTCQGHIIEEIPITQIIGNADSPERYDLASLKFTYRIYFYIDASVNLNFKEEIIEIGNRLGFSVVVRDKEYVKQCAELSKPLAFISHDSRDKDSLVRELASELSTRLCSVWYDEYSLKVGNSLRENIERGLKEAKKCVLILSPNFISNGGWTKAEFDSIYSREIHEKKNVILPIWHNIGKDEVYEYSPRLLDRMALSSSIGVKELARKLTASIND